MAPLRLVMENQDPKFIAKLNELDSKYNPQTQQLQALHDIADMVQELLNVADSTKSNTDQLQALGAVLDDSRQQLVALNKKETPESPDYAKPVVDAVQKLSREVTTQLSRIDTKPVVNVSPTPVNVAAPNVQVDAPKVDLSEIEKILKIEVPAAFQKAISAIPEPKEQDQQPILDQLTQMNEWLQSIDRASRMKPIVTSPSSGGGGSGAVTVADGADVAEGTTSDTAYTTGSGTTISVLKGIFGKDFATQTTLALIKAKTDNIDVALSTRTKPADQQHVIVDSGSITANAGTNLNTSALALDATLTSGNQQTKITNGTNVMDVVSGTYGKPALTIQPHDASPFSDGYSNSAPNYVDENFNQLVQAIFPYIFNGSTWDRLPGDKTNGQFVNVKTSVLPTGAATAAKQPSLGTAGSPSANVLSIQGVTSMTPLKVDGSAVTQPVSAASLPLPTGAATSSIQTTQQSSLTSIDGKLSGALSITGSTVGTTSATVNVGQKTVSTSAVQIIVTSTIPTNGILIGALSTNAASIFIGGSTVTTNTGVELLPGASQPFTCNLNTLYIISVASTSDKIWYNVT